MTEHRQIKLGAILQYLQMGLNILITLIYTPIMLSYLGKSEYGIYSLAGSFISYLSLLTLGFSGSYLRFYSKYKVSKDENGIKKMNGLYLITFSIMGAIALVSGFGMTSDIFMKTVFDEGLSSDEFQLARKLMIVLVINMALSFPTSVFSSYITSQEKFVFHKLVNMLRTVVSPALNIPLLLLGYKSFALVLVTFGVAIFTDSLNIIYCFKKLHIGFIFHDFEKGLFKQIFWFSFFIAINQIIDQINWSTDRLIIARYKGSSEVSVYSIGSQINTLYVSFSTAISSVFAPRVNRIVAEGKDNWNDELNTLFRKVGRIQFYVMSLILTGFIFFGKYFIMRWAGNNTNDYDDAYYIALLLIVPVTVPLIQNVGIEIQRAENKHQFRSIVYLCVAIANVIITVFLTPIMGGIGAAIGTSISLIVGNIIVMNFFYHFSLHIDMKKFWLEIVKILPAMVIPCISGTMMMLFYEFQGLWDFFLFIIAYTIVFALCVRFIGFNAYEKSFVHKVTDKVFHKDRQETNV